MPIKTPEFWYKDPSSRPSLIEKIMLPFSLIYKLGHNLNLSATNTKKAPIPVICIGNITAGGSGKTPTIIAIQKLIIKNKLLKAPYFLSRGYGGSDTKPRCISIHDDIKKTGDEPLLLAKHSKTITSVNRYDGAKMAHELGADGILMDDGFQNQGLYKDFSIIVVDGKIGFGNKKLLPAGPLREPIDSALLRAHAVIIIGDDEYGIKSIIPPEMPVFNGYIKPTKSNDIDKSAKYIGFAGLAHPKKFYNTLLQNNVDVTSFHKFSDHHPYSIKEIEALINESKDKKAKLITTEKDYMRIPKKYHSEIEYFAIELAWNNEEAVLKFLEENLSSFKDS